MNRTKFQESLKLKMSLLKKKSLVDLITTNSKDIVQLF